MWFCLMLLFIICFIFGIVLSVFTSKRKREMLDKLNNTNQQLILFREEFEKRKKEVNELKRIQKERKDNDTL